jgi:hypothetical protein
LEILGCFVVEYTDRIYVGEGGMIELECSKVAASERVKPEIPGNHDEQDNLLCILLKISRDTGQSVQHVHITPLDVNVALERNLYAEWGEGERQKAIEGPAFYHTYVTAALSSECMRCASNSQSSNLGLAPQSRVSDSGLQRDRLYISGYPESVTADIPYRV